MKKIYLIFLVLGTANAIKAMESKDAPSEVHPDSDLDPRTAFNSFLATIEERIQSEGRSPDVFADCMEYVIQRDEQKSIPLEESMDILFKKTSLEPNSIILGDFPQLGGCNYSFLQLAVLASFFKSHDQYKRIVAKSLEHGGDPHRITIVRRGLKPELTTVMNELSYWHAFTNRQHLKAQDEINHADSEERRSAWTKDLVNTAETFHNVASIRELVEQHSNKNLKKED